VKRRGGNGRSNGQQQNRSKTEDPVDVAKKRRGGEEKQKRDKTDETRVRKKGDQLDNPSVKTQKRRRDELPP